MSEFEAADNSEIDLGSLESSFTAAYDRSSAPVAVEETLEVATPVVETTTESAPIEAVADTPVEPSALDNLLSQARQYGVSTDGVASEAELANKVMARMQEMQPYVQYANDLIPHADEIRDYLAAKEKPAAPVEDEWNEEKYFQTQYGGPTFTAAHQQAVDTGIVTRDPDTGLWIAQPGFEVAAGSLLGEMNAAQQHSAKFWQQQTRGNPLHSTYKAIQEPLMRQVKAYVQEFIGGHDQQAQLRNNINSFEQKNAEWMYQPGTKTLTQHGSQFMSSISDLKSAGVSDPQTLVSMAMRMIGGPPQLSPPTPAPVAAPVPAPVAAEIPPVPQKTFLEQAKKRASHSPSAATESQPQVVDSGDLQSMFTRAFKSTASKNN